MAYYTVYWPQDRLDELRKTGDTGPIKVVFGSIHSRMPSIASIKAGDVVFCTGCADMRSKLNWGVRNLNR